MANAAKKPTMTDAPIPIGHVAPQHGQAVPDNR